MPVPSSSSKVANRVNYTDDYKMQLFTIWYNSGKITAAQLYSKLVADNIVEYQSKTIPTKNILHKWIQNEFQSKAIFLDNEVARKLEKDLITKRVAVLNEHAGVGNELYNMGMDYLREHGLGSSRNAITAVIEGLRIEKENTGTPVKFAELQSLTDDQLMEEFAKLVTSRSKIVSIEPNVDDE